MKNLKFLSPLVMLMILVSCHSDDEPKNLAPEASGIYTGYTVASCNFFSSMVTNDQIVKMSSSELNKVNISYESDTWGTITINNADLFGNDGNIHISGSGKSIMYHAGNANEYDCNVDGVLIGKDLSLSFSCPQVMGGLKIEFKQGEIPADIVVPGTYSGYTEAKSAYFSCMIADNQKIVITKNSDNSYQILYSSDTWGKFAIENATAQYSDGKFTVSGNGTTKMGMNGNVNDYDCSIAGTIDIKKENPIFTFSVPIVMGGLSIVFHSGDMPATE